MFHQACDDRSPNPSGGEAVATSKTSPCSITSTPGSAARSVARNPADGNSGADAKPSPRSRTPLSERMSWRVSSTAGARLGRGIGGGSTAGTRSWLGGSRPRTYGRQAWKKPSPSLAGFRSSSVYGKMGEAERARGKAHAARLSDKGVGDTVSDSSKDLPEHSKPGFRSGAGGNRGDGGGIGSRRRRRNKSVFDIGDWSDSSTESTKMFDSNPGKTAYGASRIARVDTTAHPIRKAAFASGAGNGGDSVSHEASVVGFTAPSKPDGRPRRPRSCSPAARTEESSGRAGPRSSGVGKGLGTTQVAPAPSGSNSGTGASDNARRGTSPPRSRTGTERGEVKDWRSNGRPPRPPRPAEALGRQDVRGAGRPLLNVKQGGGAHGRAGGPKAKKRKVRSVFELDDSDSQDACDANACELEDESD